MRAIEARHCLYSIYIHGQRPQTPGKQLKSLVQGTKSKKHDLAVGADANAQNAVWGSGDINERGVCIRNRAIYS